MTLRIFIILTILGSPAFPAAAQGTAVRDSLSEVAVAAANAALIQGAELAGRERWDDARRAFERAISWQPTLAAAHFNVGVALSVLGRGDEAIAAYREAIRLSPSMTEALINIGAELCGRNRPAEALASLERATRLSPRSAPAHHNRGVALAGLGQLEDALAAFERAAALAPNDAAIRRALITTRGNVARQHRSRRLAATVTAG